eukprot:CAMPEP_0204161806 /NCGR_PEP_ID=MMETSP0361-20130328/35029_1 /ASSEMBLY_ACC=CAM_ASM_000343 /TAXON_ID=268821 /ORGANISM="Scrippsiella Hangoei, Strain SHTV-5" /LENGTH=31 /DNA_ID= /DNA_START= /DNA_END= /DNA_ORIENTATION=
MDTGGEQLLAEVVHDEHLGAPHVLEPRGMNR